MRLRGVTLQWSWYFGDIPSRTLAAIVIGPGHLKLGVIVHDWGVRVQLIWWHLIVHYPWSVKWRRA